MTILILMPGKDSSDLVDNLELLDPNLDIRIWPDTGDKNNITYAIVWNHPDGELQNYPNLQVIASYGAGVDHIFRDQDLPSNAAVTRLADDCLTGQMSEYIAGVILNHRIRLIEFREYQAAAVWAPKGPRTGNRVCLLGLGNIGQAVALYLAALDFSVCGWSKSPKNIKNVQSYCGKDGFDEALNDADYVICLLPLTPETENILNRKSFAKMKKGAYLINVGRGAHLNEDDLLEALYDGQISGASLDVFRTEPLPQDHPFWRHPNIYITPHCASQTDVVLAASQLYKNYQNMKKNHKLMNIACAKKGY